MSQFVETGKRHFTAGAALARHLRVKLSSGKLAAAGDSDVSIGTLEAEAFADGDERAVRLRTAEGTCNMVASEAITAGDPVYAAASGKVASSGTVFEGNALTAAGANNDVIEVLRGPNTDVSAVITGTNAATFEADADLTKPRMALGSQTGGTGDFKAVLRPPTTLTADRVFTTEGDAAATLANATGAQTWTGVKTLSSAPVLSAGYESVAAEVTPAADSGGTSLIAAGVTAVDVQAVTNDVNDWIVLPAIADVPIGHTITIACNAGGNFELRTPAASNTKINNVDADGGTAEYLCTDTEVVKVVKMSDSAGWMAHAFSKLGAVVTAVVPD